MDVYLHVYLAVFCTLASSTGHSLVNVLHVYKRIMLSCSVFATFPPFRPNLLQVISQTVELLVHACSSSDHHIRLSASENLRKMIKVGTESVHNK